MMPGIAPVTASIGKRLAYAGGGSSASALSSYSFSDVPFGAPAANRYLFACIPIRRSVSGTIDITAVTIGGVSATAVFDESWDSNRNELGIWRALVPEGTTGTVAVTLSQTSASCSAQLVAAYGWHATPTVQTSGSSNSTSDTTTRTATTAGNVDAGAHLLACCRAGGGATVVTYSGDVGNVGTSIGNPRNAVGLGFVQAGGSTKSATITADAAGQQAVILLALT